MYTNNTGYSTSDLVSRVFTGVHLPFNFSPKNLSKEEDQKKLDIFFSIGNFNYHLFLIENGFLNKFEFVAELKFRDQFLEAVKHPSKKTRKAADHYSTWFKMCCNLKFLLKKEGLLFFKLFSALSEKYNEKDCEKFWEECEPEFGSIPLVFSIIEKYVPPDPNLDRKELIKKHFLKNKNF